jgi:hypothetical protein
VLEDYLDPKKGTSAPTRKVVSTSDDDWGDDVTESPSAAKSKTVKRTGNDVADEFANLFEKN